MGLFTLGLYAEIFPMTHDNIASRQPIRFEWIANAPEQTEKLTNTFFFQFNIHLQALRCVATHLCCRGLLGCHLK